MATTDQPGPTPEMKVSSGGNRNALNKPINSHGERDWSHGLFSCCDEPGTCCFSWFCACIQYSKNKSRLAHLERDGTPHPDGGDGVGVDCLLFCCLAGAGFHWILEMTERAAVRTRYRIEGSTLNDCLASYCCAPCELTQATREIALEEQSFGGKTA